MLLTPRGLRFAGRILPCSIGRGGLSATKTEGDGRTPIGLHRIVGMLYRPDRLPRPSSWAEVIGPRDLWSDDQNAPEYNHHVRAPYAASHEKLHRADPLYDLILVTDWNWPNAQSGRGSAIFLHQWRRPGYPTEGCIALSRQDLTWLAQRISPGTRLVVPPLSR
ncbi:L,D-transpeptidase family protein [Phaeobacter porticola]|uniref:L,D-transpeptidase family protein n=1 Tax=Phaeobacter porticola TaxID=1844006 RepID=UPI000931D4AC|nr:L,D-transpeptidase family protein [Phaeobacter porticola]